MHGVKRFSEEAAMLTDLFRRVIENCKSSPSSVSCVHGHFCGSRHHPGLPNVGSIAAFALPLITDHETRIATDFGVSVNDASYLTSIQIAVLGVAPIFWKPLSNRWGRRPIFLLSLICSLVCNVGCAESTSYASTAVCRALQAFFISPASGKTQCLPYRDKEC